MTTGRKHSPSGDRVFVPKTSQCLWCGHSEALGAVLKERRLGAGQPKMECVDAAACNARIKRRILLGP